MLTLFVKEPCNPNCDCQNDKNKKKVCKCQQQFLLEIPLPNNPFR